MSHRYRLDPTPAQAAAMVEWCAHARFVWNLALEQRNYWRRGMRSLSGYDQKAQLAEARAASEWLRSGPSVVQQQAVLDLDQAFRNWWGGSHRRPTWRRRGVNEGFAIRDLTVQKLNRKWATVLVPKVGPVKFRLSRSLPEGTKSARVTLDRSGRWHVSFVAVPPPVEGPDDGSVVGIDRGIAINFQCSDGRRWDVAGLSVGEKRRLRLLQRKMARQERGSNRRERTRLQIARLKAREVDRRKDAIEKATTELARTCDVVAIEDLRIKNMTRSAAGTVENPGTNVAQKRGLNRSILENGWGLFAQRLGDKIGDRMVTVPAPHTSTTCSACGNRDARQRESQARFACRSCGLVEHADVNAARNIAAAGQAVSGRGGPVHARPPCEASTTLVGAT